MEQKYQADPKTSQEICEFVREYEKRFNKHDWVAVAALCTEDAIQIGPEGPVCGREAIEKKYADLFQRLRPTNIVCTVDQVSAIGNVSWNSGGWSCTLEGESGPVPIKGYRLDILIRDGDVWKECISCSTLATPETPNAKSPQ
jgi:ketosteroid isomerase-like protein